MSEPDEAKHRFSTIKAQIDNGGCQKAKPEAAISSATPMRAFGYVANAYKNDAESLT